MSVGNKSDKEKYQSRVGLSSNVVYVKRKYVDRVIRAFCVWIKHSGFLQGQKFKR